MLNLSLSTVAGVVVVLLVPALTLLFGDRAASWPARLALGLGLAAAVLFLGSMLSGAGAETGYLIAATVGIGLAGRAQLISP